MTGRNQRRHRTRNRSGGRSRGASRVGERFEATVGPVAHGGHCVVRLDPPEARVVFTRHALPGERVIVEITEGGERDRWWRGDAVEVLEASPDRVSAPCPVAGPGLCGGCDFQHVALAAQRHLKADVVREQMVRLGGLAEDDPLLEGLTVEAVPVPGRPDDGLRWRTRVRFAHTPEGRRGLRAHRSHRVVPVEDCLIAHPDALTEDRPEVVTETVRAARGERTHEVAGEGFWQVHPGAASTLVEAVLAMLAPQPGESVLDLYAGVGLLAGFLADAVGPRARVRAVEGDRVATGHARRNLADHPGLQVVTGEVAAVLASGLDEPFDLVVLDPPREGARRAVVEAIVERAPRAAAYVACDPAALARDVAIFAEHGYRLRALRAFDLFPMTHHVECVALLTR